MFHTVYCLVQQHNLGLVLLAALVCAVATSTAFRLLIVGEQASGRTQLWWLVFAGACCGAGTWATHFIAMLAFDMGVKTGYDVFGTVASLGMAVAGMIAAVLAAVMTPKPWKLPVWGVLFAGTVGAMHYSGMWAMKIAGTMTWNPIGVVTSFMLCGVFAMGALWLLHRSRTIKMFAAASACLTVAICALHFTGMGAMSMTPDASVAVSHADLPRDLIALCVGGLTVVIVLAGIATLWNAARSQRTSLELLRSVIDAIQQGLAYFDAEDRYVLGNDTYLKDAVAGGLHVETGMTYAEMMARSAEDLVGPESTQQRTAWIEKVIESRAANASSRDQLTMDGRFLRIQNNRAVGGGLVTLVSDITGLKRQAEELTAARDAAEAAAHAKDDFLTNMSHELRTPMNGVIGVAELLAREEMTPRQAELVDLIRSSSDTLNRLLCDILDVVKVKSGGMEITEALFDLRRAVESVTALFRVQAELKGLTVVLQIGDGVDGLFIGDEVRVKQVLANLVSNAVKFTDSGSVTIALDAVGPVIRLTVTDTGVGFDEAVGQRLFSRFEQADASLTRRFGGAGLGLAISKELAVRMGGDLTCDSTPGAGAVFTLALPLPHADGEALAVVQSVEASIHVDDETYAPPRTLVVDDNATNRRVLTLILEGAGIEVAYAENGQEAVELWRSGAFDVILMDIQMPVMDGFTATREIRDAEVREGRLRTPIIMVSANAMPEHLAASYSAGADDHVAKPVTAATLFAALERLDHVNDDEPDAEAVA